MSNVDGAGDWQSATPADALTTAAEFCRTAWLQASSLLSNVCRYVNLRALMIKTTGMLAFVDHCHQPECWQHTGHVQLLQLDLQ